MAQVEDAAEGHINAAAPFDRLWRRPSRRRAVARVDAGALDRAAISAIRGDDELRARDALEVREAE